MTSRLALTWPDPALFAQRGGRPLRLLALSDEEDSTLDSATNREQLGPIDLLIGCGDLQPLYLSAVADFFAAPLLYVRGNHDVGAAWHDQRRRLLPQPLSPGTLVSEQGIRLLALAGAPRYNDGEMQYSELEAWPAALRAYLRARNVAPLLVVSHAAPRGAGDAPDRAHRGFAAYRWLAQRLAPPLWLHGHTALVRRGVDDRCVQVGETLFYNCTGATLIELSVPGA